MITKVNTGLSDAELKEITAVLKRFHSVESAVIFGSRAKGNFRKGSDVDIAIKGKNITFRNVSDINYELNDESSLIYFFDIIDYNSIENVDLREHIDRVGVEFFLKKAIE